MNKFNEIQHSPITRTWKIWVPFLKFVKDDMISWLMRSIEDFHPMLKPLMICTTRAADNISNMYHFKPKKRRNWTGHTHLPHFYWSATESGPGAIPPPSQSQWGSRSKEQGFLRWNPHFEHLGPPENAPSRLSPPLLVPSKQTSRNKYFLQCGGKRSAPNTVRAMTS